MSSPPEVHVDGTLWVEPVLDPGEPFRIRLHLGGRTWTLGREGAVRHALAVLSAAHAADHDAATLRLLAATGVSAPEAAHLVVSDLRPDREPLDSAAVAPLGLEAVVDGAGEAVVLLLLDGQPVGQWDAGGAVAHAVTVLGAMLSASLDAALYQAMVTHVGLEPARARNVVHGHAEHRRL